MTPAPDARARWFLPAIFLLFTASGFAGLIYESIWSHYLKLFLGHAAYAQTLVLVIFMGGMALGAWLCSRLSRRWVNLLFAYAVIEALVGAASLAFHQVFVATLGFAFETAIPALDSALAAEALKWLLAAALILPQSILLGMTFPLMASAVLRARPARPGYAVAMLYFSNSLGAAVGVLASAFYFIPAAGLPGSLIAAASINLAVAAAVILLPRTAAGPVAPAAEPAPAAAANHGRLLVAVAAATGMSSFMYEIGWIRMLSLVLGASTHAFELMLSAFILGLAFGGLWVRRRIDATRDALRLLGLVQLAMGIAALATLPVYARTFHAMEWALGMLSPTAGGYAAFNVVSHGLCLAVMFPAAFCAGMTLPLITAALMRRGFGERAVGQVYAANTAGAIAGVVLAVHVGLPLLGVKGLIVAGAAIDLALGVALLRAASPAARGRLLVAGAASLAVLAAALFLVRLDAHDMASGVFRYARLMDRSKDEVVAHEDGKTATVSVVRTGDMLALRTNGKPDGSVRVDSGGVPSADEVTQTLLGALPVLLLPEAKRMANIGFGTGVTSHVALASRTLEVLDTVEIEPAMVRAAQHFLPFNQRALSDPRSRLHFEDAKTFFAARRGQYDAIISEPSNPWVSGVSSLFSAEFYADVQRALKPGGLLVQWMHLYEMSPPLLASVIEALRPSFSDYVLWAANNGDLIIVAANGGRVPEPSAERLGDAALAAQLARFGIRTLDDLNLHRIAGRGAIGPLFAEPGVVANSDYFPLLDTGAARARFMRQDARALFTLLDAALPVLALLEPGHAPDPGRITPGDRVNWPRPHLIAQADQVARYLISADEAALGALPVARVSDLVMLRSAVLECGGDAPGVALRWALADVAQLVNAHLPPKRAQEVWRTLERARCVNRLKPAERQWLRLHAAVARRDASVMARDGQALLDGTPELTGHLAAYALAALMTARILEGQESAARQAFHLHRGRLRDAPSWQEVFRLLVNHAS